MKIIFTKSKLPLSWFVRWGLEEDVSHVAIVFDNKIVFHSNLYGLHIEWYNTFKKHNEVVYEIEYDLPLEQEEAMYQAVIDANDGKSYDYKAFMYFVWCGFKRKFFNTPLPATNKWDRENSLLCVEVLALLPRDILSDLNKLPKDLSMMSPKTAYNLLRS